MERITYMRPAYHKVHEDPSKNYGVGGLTISMVVKGDKGAVHFVFGTGMYLPETYEYWDSKGLHQRDNHPDHMGYDVGYHSPVPMDEYQKEDGPRWPTKMRKTGEGIADVAFDKIGDAPPSCEWLGVPCYCDGSALRADEWMKILLREGSDKIWEMLEEYYKDTFETV